MPFQIGSHQFENRLLLAPMAGVTDRPFRKLCKALGAGITVSEMLTSDRRLWHTPKSRLRLDHRGESGPRVVQIAGGDADMLADAARANAEHGADIIDINMGCPAKKVCNKAAGSALLRDEALVGEILDAVVKAVSVPVTLKIRTGWSSDSRNGVRIAQLAESLGIKALAVHGRTREQKFVGEAEYDTIRAIKEAVTIPVIANGDIDSPAKAAQVLAYTGADGLMIGRAAQGNPWIFREIQHYLSSGEQLAPPSHEERLTTMRHHLNALHEHYGDFMGVRVARKHVGWYLSTLAEGREARATFNTLDHKQAQLDFLDHFFDQTSLHTPDGSTLQ
ncbi:tRNA dihydrouridine synthase DusB [Carnimonas nigrificans]|uniref:tRNA dihydrouridine synthase DusB n=1 Tax=Carnimonas nigrificans TaxID=64323 RepID=UPI00046E7C1C|nr:tRNA dihydrouridine synthase DusB [Carnimonas nigrificans]